MNTALQGLHFLIEIKSETPLAVFNNSPQLENILQAIASQSGMQVLKGIFHTFEPMGVTGVLVLAESHISIHTWPEHNYAAMDLFTCNTQVDTTMLRQAVQQHFSHCQIQITSVERGFKS